MSAIENLIKNEQQQIICPSCGAHFDIHEKECPYCGTVNEFGDEARYIKKLEDIREDMIDTADIPDEAYEREVKSNIKKALVVIGIILLIAFGIAAAAFCLTKIGEARDKKAAMEELAWQRENFAKLDELFEKGDYEGVLAIKDSLSLDGNYSYFWGWEHYQFMEAYTYYKNLKDSEELINNNEENYVNKEWMFENCMNLLYERWDIRLKTVRSIDQKEYDTIMEYAEYAKDYLKRYMGLSDEEIADLRGRVIFDPPGEGVDYSKCKKVFKELTE